MLNWARLLSGLQQVNGLVWRVQDGFIHRTITIAVLSGRWGSAWTVGWSVDCIVSLVLWFQGSRTSYILTQGCQRQGVRVASFLRSRLEIRPSFTSVFYWPNRHRFKGMEYRVNLSMREMSKFLVVQKNNV